LPKEKEGKREIPYLFCQRKGKRALTSVGEKSGCTVKRKQENGSFVEKGKGEDVQSH